MRINIKNILVIVATAFVLASCDSISDDNRYIYVKPADVTRAVLLEDFTGQKCVNCPAAAEEIHAMQTQYGDTAVIAVGIHSGPLGVFPTGTVVGLRTALGDEYYNHWGIEVEPSGVIDRDGSVYVADKWATQVHNEIQKTSPVRITLKSSYTESSKKATITTSALSGESYNGKLQLWLVEDSITALQMMKDGTVNKNYVHNHVLRTAINGTWGEDFNLAEGVENTNTASITLDDAWVPEHCSVVAFLYNSDGVIQVTKTKIK
jgi:hypothetical protein